MQNDSEQNQSTIKFQDLIKNFYQKNKIYIFSFILILIIISSSIGFYFKSKEKKHLLMSELYVKAKIDLNNGKNEEAKNHF